MICLSVLSITNTLAYYRIYTLKIHNVFIVQAPDGRYWQLIYPNLTGTHFSTLIRNGKFLLQQNPLDCESPWVSDDGSETMTSDLVAAEMSSIGAELAVLQISETLFWPLSLSSAVAVEVVGLKLLTLG